VNAPRDQFCDVGQIRTRYWTDGDRGSPVVLVPGVPGYIEDWLPSIGALAARHRVYALDLVGQGLTDKPPDASYEITDLARFVRDFMTAQEIDRAHVVAHSFGGAIAIRLTLLFPEVVDRLVLVASAGLGREINPLFRLSGVPLIGNLLTRPSRSGSATFAKMLVHDPVVVTEESIERDYQMTAQPGAHQAFLRAVRTNVSLLSGQSERVYGPHLSGLASITSRVLIVWGAQDRIVPVAHAGVAAECLPSARLRVFEDCGHVPMLEQTQAFNASLLEFIND
jgi:pimeloyl-ACP methyl ester carboxylesterase